MGEKKKRYWVKWYVKSFKTGRWYVDIKRSRIADLEEFIVALEREQRQKRWKHISSKLHYSASTLAVASSSTRILFSRIMALAKHNNCLWPTLKLLPPSNISVFRPSGKLSTTTLSSTYKKNTQVKQSSMPRAMSTFCLWRSCKRSTRNGWRLKNFTFFRPITTSVGRRSRKPLSLSSVRCKKKKKTTTE